MSGTDVIAIVAFVLSLFNVWHTWRENGPRLDVEKPIHSTIKYFVTTSSQQEERSTSVLRIRMSNPTVRAVHVNGIYLYTGKELVTELEEWHQMVNSARAFFTVESFRQREYNVDLAQISKTLADTHSLNRQFRIRVHDEVGRHYDSKPFVIQPD